MSYLPRNRSRSPFTKKAVSLALLFLIAGGMLSFFDSAIISAISPLWRAENGISRTLGKSVDFFHSRNSLMNENASLRERLASLELETSALALANSENERLLALLGRRVAPSAVSAAVLSYPPQSPYDLLVIDAGEREGVSVGAKVALPEGPEIGVVEEVTARYSRVKLFSTNGEKTEAVLERNSLPVTLEGEGAGNFKIVVPRDTPVEVGDRILSGNLETSLVAVVEEVSLNATDAFKEVRAKSPANIFSIRFVSIEP